MVNKSLVSGICCAVGVIYAAVSIAEIHSDSHHNPIASYQVPLAAKSLLTDIISISDQKWLAVGERGHILNSSDGISWQQASVPAQANLNSIFFINAQQGWAVGHDATVLTTQDGGHNWELQLYLPETDKPLFDIYFTDELQGIAVGAYGMFYRTIDGGKSWQPEFHEELLSEDDQDYLAELKETDPDSYELEKTSLLPHFNRLVMDDSSLLMVGEGGFVAESHDFGHNWKRLESFYNGSLFDAIRTPQQTLLVAGLRGNLFRSTDHGESWERITLPESATLNSIFAGSEGELYLTGNAGTLLFSTDDGQTFTNLSETDGKAIMNGVVAADQLILVTEVGIKHKSIKSE